MKKYVLVLLMLVSVKSLLADDATFRSGFVSPEATSNMRAVTRGEFDGTDPITVKVNEQLIIPMHYHRCNLSNNISIFFGAVDTSIMNVLPAGVNWSDNGMSLDLNLVCIGMQVGQTTVRFGEGNDVLKELNIQIVE